MQQQKHMSSKNIYITQNLKELEPLSIEQLVKMGIWRSEKNGKYKYQYFSSMADDHLQNAINIFMRTNNHIVLEALCEELARRKRLADNVKQKIKQMTNNNTTTQTEFGFAESQTTYSEALKAAETLQSSENMENYIKAEFTKGQVVGPYTIVEVSSTNNRGYSLVVQKNGEEAPFVISQSRFKEKLGMRNYKKAKKKTTKKAPVKKKAEASVVNNKVTYIEQKFKVGYIVGSREILRVRRSNKGVAKGFAYFVRDAKGKKYWMKQSQLKGEVIKNTAPSNTPTVDDYAVKDTPPANNVIKEEIKKLSFFDKVKMLFS